MNFAEYLKDHWGIDSEDYEPEPEHEDDEDHDHPSLSAAERNA
jgi:hypothetical protein